MPRLLGLFLLLLSPLSWGGVSFSTNIHPEIYFTTANEACASLKDEADNPMVGPNGVVEGVYADGSLICFYRYSDPSQFGGTRTNGFTVGGVAPKAQTKECTAGTSASWSLTRPNLNGLGPIEYVCQQGCRVTLGTSECQPEFEGATTGVCFGVGTLNGDACATSDHPPGGDTDPTDPDPCVANPSGEGCTPPDPCVADPNAEGCTPPDPCVADPDAEGCPTDPGDGGTDPGDGGTDPGDGGTDPGDGGTDPGDGGTDPGDGGDGDGSAGGYMNCDAPFACDGDAIACAQLQVQKQLMCDGQDTDFPSQKGDIDDFLDNPDFKAEDDEEINLGNLFSEGTRFLPSSCPTPESLSLITGGGHSFRLSYEPLCQFASDLGVLIVIASGIFYAIYVGRAVGGE